MSAVDEATTRLISDISHIVRADGNLPAQAREVYDTWFKRREESRAPEILTIVEPVLGRCSDFSAVRLKEACDAKVNALRKSLDEYKDDLLTGIVDRVRSGESLTDRTDHLARRFLLGAPSAEVASSDVADFAPAVIEISKLCEAKAREVAPALDRLRSLRSRLPGESIAGAMDRVATGLDEAARLCIVTVAAVTDAEQAAAAGLKLEIDASARQVEAAREQETEAAEGLRRAAALYATAAAKRAAEEATHQQCLEAVVAVHKGAELFKEELKAIQSAAVDACEAVRGACCDATLAEQELRSACLEAEANVAAAAQAVGMAACEFRALVAGPLVRGWKSAGTDSERRQLTVAAAHVAAAATPRCMACQRCCPAVAPTACDPTARNCGCDGCPVCAQERYPLGERSHLEVAGWQAPTATVIKLTTCPAEAMAELRLFRALKRAADATSEAVGAARHQVVELVRDRRAELRIDVLSHALNGPTAQLEAAAKGLRACLATPLAARRLRRDLVRAAADAAGGGGEPLGEMVAEFGRLLRGDPAPQAASAWAAAAELRGRLEAAAGAIADAIDPQRAPAYVAPTGRETTGGVATARFRDGSPGVVGRFVVVMAGGEEVEHMPV